MRKEVHYSNTYANTQQQGQLNLVNKQWIQISL
jgi:hypothetical protein